MDIENVKNKIKKLLALSEDNPSDAESFSALQKAQELMAMYKLQQSDLKEEEKKLCVKKKTILSYGTRSSNHYRNDLADIISENFCCINYISTTRGTRTHYISFMGMEDDVDIATEVLYAADAAIVRGCNRLYKELQDDLGRKYIPTDYYIPHKLGYVKGYLAGLKVALESQKEKHQEWGLVLVVPQEAQDYLSNLKGRDCGGHTRMVSRFYDTGYQDGSNFHLNKKLENASSQGMIE